MKMPIDHREGEAPAEPRRSRLRWLGRSLALPLVFACSVAAADWPVVRGDAAGTGVAQTNLADDLDVLWNVKAEDAAVEATAVIVNGMIYVGDDAGTMRALRLSDGSPVWTKTFADTGFLTPAAVGDGALFVSDYDGVVRCMSLSDGSVVWEFNTESESYNGPNMHAGALLIPTESGDLISLDAKTGEEKWQFAIDGPLRCSPSVAVSANNEGHALLAGCDARLTAVNLSTGKEVGAVDIGGQTGSTPALVGGKAYFGAESGEFLAIDAADLKTPTVAWRYRDPRRGQGIRTAAAVNDRAVVYGNQGKALYALDPTNGEPLWTKPTKSRVESSPVIAPSTGGGHRVVATTTRGRLLLLDLASGETVWEYEAGGGFVASPAVVDGRIVIGNTDGTLYCFGRKGARE